MTGYPQVAFPADAGDYTTDAGPGRPGGPEAAAASARLFMASAPMITRDGDRGERAERANYCVVSLENTQQDRHQRDRQRDVDLAAA